MSASVNSNIEEQHLAAPLLPTRLAGTTRERREDEDGADPARGMPGLEGSGTCTLVKKGRGSKEGDERKVNANL